MQHEASTPSVALDYATPPPPRRTRVAVVTLLMGLFALFLAGVNEVVTVVPSKVNEAHRWESGYVLLFASGLLLGCSIGIRVARPRSGSAA
jgi:uncharacterized membrane protein HdeD (DUF308 family)